MSEDKKFDPFICFSTRVISSACEMIEEIGYLNGVRHSTPQHVHQPYQMTDLRRAVARAQAALESYDACMAGGVEEIAGVEFEAIAKAKAA